jgi:hypothetical protein
LPSLGAPADGDGIAAPGDQALAVGRRRYIATPARPAPAISTPAAIWAIGTLFPEPVVGSWPGAAGAGAAAATVRVAVAVSPLSEVVPVTVYVPGAVGAVNVTVAVPPAGCEIQRDDPAGPVHVAESLSPPSMLTLTVSPSVHPLNMAENDPPGATVPADRVSVGPPGGYALAAAPVPTMHAAVRATMTRSRLI